MNPLRWEGWPWYGVLMAYILFGLLGAAVLAYMGVGQ